jgi:hypothetical protein
VYAELDLLRGKPFHEPAHKLRRENFRQDGAHDHHGSHHRDDDGERLLRVGVALLGKKARVDRNERDRGRAPGHNVVEKVRQRERRYIRVGLRSRAEGKRDVGLARIPDDARQHHRSHQQQRRRECSVLMRRAKKAQQIRH